MALIRAVHRVTRTGTVVAAALNACGYPYRRSGGTYTVDTPDARLRFRLGEWMLFCRSGLYRVVPTPLEDLDKGDGIAGLDTGRDGDIYDAVLVLRHRPQVCCGSIRLVPDPDRCYPAPYRFGVVYADGGTKQAWKVVPE